MAPVRATLVIPDRKLLPGVPFDMWVDVENSSDATIAIGLRPHLVVQRDAELPFEISSRQIVPLSAHRGVYLTLSGRERGTLSLPLNLSAQYKEFYADPRLSPPGHYRFGLRLDDRFYSPLGPPEKPLSFAGTVLTNMVDVERIEPVGSDASVWRRLQESQNQQWKLTDWWSARVVLEILSSWPDSNYVPYAVLAGAGGPACSSLVLDTIDRFPETPVIDELHVVASRLLGSAEDYDRYRKELRIVQESQRPTTRRIAADNGTQ